MRNLRIHLHMRGIRQGDLVSLYILFFVSNPTDTFTLCQLKQMFLGISIKLTNYSPNISYMMFTNDCLIFYKTTKQEAREVNHIEIFEQLVNSINLKVQFSAGVSTLVKKEIADILRINPGILQPFYLGCSNIDKRKARCNFDDIESNLADVKAHILSNTGRTFLIKSMCEIYRDTP